MRWIVVDGIDGSGKTSVASWISEYYESKGEKTLVRVHPSSGTLGRISRKGLVGKGAVMRWTATLFFIFDVLLSVARLKSDSRKCDTLIYVRYLMATAYLPERYMRLGYEFFAKLLPVPAQLLLVDVDAASAAERIRKRGGSEEMFEDIESLEEARRKVLALAGGSWKRLDNSSDEGSARDELIRILKDWDASA